MEVADNYVREIEQLSYGKDLRKPIHDTLKILMKSEKSPRPAVVLPKKMNTKLLKIQILILFTP